MQRGRKLCLVGGLILTLAMSASAIAMVIPHESGVWPKNWPAELESFRAESRTLDIATGTQEMVHTIPVKDQAAFNIVWEAVQKLRSPNGTLTLLPLKGAAKAAEKVSGKIAPAVMVFSPVESAITTDGKSGIAVNPVQQIDCEPIIARGDALSPRAPWEANLIGKDGELPEYVTSGRGEDGRLHWTAVAAKHRDSATGFQYRARIDLALVVDGTVIDLNKFKLPPGITVIDKRFD